VERIPAPEALKKLGRGVLIQGRKTLPCRAWILEPQPEVVAATPRRKNVDATPPSLVSNVVEATTPPSGDGASPPPIIPPRVPPIRFRKSVPDCWIGLELIEGKNRQVRRMTAAIGHPTLRLMRVRIGNFRLGELPLGQWRVLTEKEGVFILDTSERRCSH